MSGNNSRYGLHRQPLARSGLLANRENRPVPVERIHSESFGVARPVTEEQIPILGAYVTALTDAVDEYTIARHIEAATIDQRDDFGITFAERRRVQYRLATAIRSGFDIGRLPNVLRQCGDDGVLTLGIGAVRWFRPHGSKADSRKMVVEFADTPELEQLAEEYQAVRLALARVGLRSVSREEPKLHMTLFEYGNSRDGLRLGERHKRRVERTAEELLEAHTLFAVDVMPLVMGSHYRIEHPVVKSHPVQPELVPRARRRHELR